MITANFTGGTTAEGKREHGIWQWDYGQVLRISGLKLPTAVEIHFSLQERGGDSVTRIGTTKDGVTDVVIPDSMLENQTVQDYSMFAFIYLTDETSGRTEYKVRMTVKARPKPEAFDKPEEAELFRKAITAVNESADRADAAADAAEQTEADMKDWVFGQKTEITGIRDEAVTAKNTAVENANIAVNHAEETEADKQAAERAKTAVESLKEATDANLKQSEWFVQEQAAMLGKVPMIYATVSLEELQAVPNAKEGDFGIIQEPNGMLFRQVAHNTAGEEIPPSWVWMTDLNIAFHRESLLGILNLADVATSGSYSDLSGIPKRYNPPLVLDATGEAVTWDYAQSDTAVVALTESKALDIQNSYNGAVAVIHCYGGVLDFTDTEKFNTSVTLGYIEPLEDEHITYTLFRNAAKWDVSALPFKGADADA